MLKEIKIIKFNRVVIPEDADSLDINTINVTDTTKRIACATIYVKFKRRPGNYSCQLIFNRPKLVLKGMPKPRSELFAAILNAHNVHIVRRALNRFYKTYVKLTHSQTVLQCYIIETTN